MFRENPLLYLHPVAGLITTALIAYAASLGLRARSARRDADLARRRHRRVAPIVYVLVLANWVGGLAVVWWLEPDLDPAASGHFTVGTLIVLLLSAGALLSLRVPTDARARAVHPVLGAAALLLAGVQVFLGLQILP
jgi:hypothetical protein